MASTISEHALLRGKQSRVGWRRVCCFIIGRILVSVIQIAFNTLTNKSSRRRHRESPLHQCVGRTLFNQGISGLKMRQTTMHVAGAGGRKSIIYRLYFDTIMTCYLLGSEKFNCTMKIIACDNKMYHGINEDRYCTMSKASSYMAL